MFGDGTRIGLGNSQSSSTPDATQYGTSGNDTFWVNGGIDTINGGAGADVVDFNNSGSGVVGVSTVTFANGTTSTADEVDFAADLLNTTPNPNETTASSIPAAVEALPWLKGYGQLYNLDVAMSGDATLQQDVTALTQVAAGNISGFDADTTAILYEWAA